MGWLFCVSFIATIVMLITDTNVPLWIWVVDGILGFAWAGMVGEGSKNTSVNAMDKWLFDKGMTYSNGHEYEKYVAYVLEQKGYKNVRITPKSGDYGADVLCVNRNGKKVAVQCKMYSKPVGYKAVEEAISGMHYYGCDIAMVATNNTFTKQAHDAAKRMGVVLIERLR